MFIKYKNDEIVLNIPTSTFDPSQPMDINNPTATEEIIKNHVKTFTDTGTYIITDIGTWSKNSPLYGYSIGKVNGSITDFITNNPTYEEVTTIPDDINFVYFSSKKLSERPKNLFEILKFNAREEIESEIGDIYDLLADVSKRVVLLERVVIRLANDLLTSTPENIPTIVSMYTPAVTQYMALLEYHNTNVDAADLEDPMELFAKLYERSFKIAEIVKTNYSSKVTNTTDGIITNQIAEENNI